MVGVDFDHSRVSLWYPKQYSIDNPPRNCVLNFFGCDVIFIFVFFPRSPNYHQSPCAVPHSPGFFKWWEKMSSWVFPWYPFDSKLVDANFDGLRFSLKIIKLYSSHDIVIVCVYNYFRIWSNFYFVFSSTKYSPRPRFVLAGSPFSKSPNGDRQYWLEISLNFLFVLKWLALISIIRVLVCDTLNSILSTIHWEIVSLIFSDAM